jgi:hypothetical protein
MKNFIEGEDYRLEGKAKIRDVLLPTATALKLEMLG